MISEIWSLLYIMNRLKSDQNQFEKATKNTYRVPIVYPLLFTVREKTCTNYTLLFFIRIILSEQWGSKSSKAKNNLRTILSLELLSPKFAQK